MPKVTIQARRPQAKENQVAQSYLQEFGVTFGRAIRTSFCLRNRQGKTKESNKSLRTSIASVLETRYGLSNNEAKNASLRGIAAYDSQASLVDIYIEEAKAQINLTRKSIGKNYGLIKKAQRLDQRFEVRRLKKSNHYKTNRIVKTAAHINRRHLYLDLPKFCVALLPK